MEVAKADGDKTSDKITLQDFKNILNNRPQIKDPLADAIEGINRGINMGEEDDDYDGRDGGEDGEGESEEDEAQYYKQ